jgi:hypothetical protein
MSCMSMRVVCIRWCSSWLHVVGEVDANEGKGKWEEADDGEPHSTEWIRLAAVMIGRASRNKTGGGRAKPGHLGRVLGGNAGRFIPQSWRPQDGVRCR